MLMKMFSLYDTKGQCFGAPFVAPRREMAVRAIVELLRSGAQMPVISFPEDFVMYELGEFDDATGVVQALPPDSLGPVTQWKGNGHG